MTFSPAQQRIKLRTNTKPRFERIRIVEKNMPQEIRLVFQKHCELLESEPAEKLMPCGMRYPEPIRARPNFFIPILVVSSYVLPFFMLMFFGLYSRWLPGAAEVAKFAIDHGQIGVHGRFDASLLGLFLMLLPMAAGGLTAYVLSKNTKLSLKMKILAWLIGISILVVSEVYFGNFLKLV